MKIDLSEVKNPQLRRVIEKALLIADHEVQRHGGLEPLTTNRQRDPAQSRVDDYERALAALQLGD